MSLTEFAMVEELACLISDNLPCKHLVLSMEEALVNFLREDTRLDGVLELEPMNPYKRMLIHRLADIFGFSHHSVGEGDERHLVLERCSETSIPSVLVSDLLWQYDDVQSPKNNVEEVACLIKDNLPCKHHVLSMEKVLVNFLREDTRLDGVLELEPMTPYNRMLIHRLADIFGFSHHSVGEGDERHLVLERFSETSIPSLLVSDVLCQYDDVPSPKTISIIRQSETQPGHGDDSLAELSLERNTTPFTSRQKIFLTDEYETRPVKQRPQHDPSVAKRMITHALGQRTNLTNREVSLRNDSKCEHHVKVQSEEEGAINSTSHTDIEVQSTRYPKPSGSKVPEQRSERISTELNLSTEGVKNNIQIDSSSEELTGAAKRLFANALGIHQRVGIPSKSNETRQTKLT